MATTIAASQWEKYAVVNGRTQTRRQIGWYVVSEPKEFTWHGEYAADYGFVTVRPGRYPIYALRDCGRPWHSLSISMPGIVKAGSWWNRVEAGTPRDAHVSPYPHSVAAAIVAGEPGPIELLPEVEARRIDFEYEGEPHHTHGLFVDGEKI